MGPFFESLEPLQVIWHDLTSLESHNFKIQAQENNKVHLFEEMRNSTEPSEKKPPLVVSVYNDSVESQA